MGSRRPRPRPGTGTTPARAIASALVAALLVTPISTAAQDDPAPAAGEGRQSAAGTADAADGETGDAAARETGDTASGESGDAETGDAVNADAHEVLSEYQSAVAAAEAEDFAAYTEHAQRALALAPGHPALLRHVARAMAFEERHQEALSWLHMAVETGVTLDIAHDRAFESLRADTTFKADSLFAAMVDREHELRTPGGRCDVVYEIPERDLVPEGIAYDPTADVFYVGSIRQRKVLRLDREGNATPFVASGRDGLLGALGLRVDVERRRLWVASAELPEMEGARRDGSGRAAVHAFDLETAAVVRAAGLSREEGAINLNDLVVAPDGTVYVTEAEGGAIYTLAPDESTLHAFLPPGSLFAPNGIAISPDGTLLYVSQYAVGLTLIDVETGEVTLMRHPHGVCTVAIDGLYRHGSSLVAIQNGRGLAQVARFRLDADGRSIRSMDVLCRHHPRFGDPTTGAIAGREILVIADSQIPLVFADGSLPSMEDLRPTYLVRVGL